MKKSFKDTVVGKLLLGLSGSIPVLGPIISGASSLEDVLRGLGDSNLDPEQKVELQKAIFEAQAVEQQELTKRLEIDSHNRFTRNIRPVITILYTSLFILTLFLDSFPAIPFELSGATVNALTALNGVIIGFWFGGRTLEKIKGI